MEKFQNRARIIAFVSLAVIAGVAVWMAIRSAPNSGPASIPQPIASVSFQCRDGKGIFADFFTGSSTPGTPGKPPVPGGSVAVSLSDGRRLSLPQTVSADGTRYANADESLIFWAKGNGAFLLEHNAQTFMGCVRIADDPGGLPLAYADGTQGFSLRYPEGYRIDPEYRYQGLGPGKEIGGVKFTIPAAMASGTNLSTDSGFSVEEIPMSPACDAADFLHASASSTGLADGGTAYSFASSSDAGAGNRYEELVYSIPGTNPCIAIRYFAHFPVFENYPSGTVQQVDRSGLIEQFDRVRRTLVVL